MRKLFLQVSAGIIGIAVLVFAGFAAWNLFLAEPNIIESVNSPDGEYTAYLYESNGGATSDWTYHISVLESGKELKKGSGNVYISRDKPNGVEWTGERELYVDDYKSVNTTKQETEVKGVTVRYNSLGN